MVTDVRHSAGVVRVQQEEEGMSLVLERKMAVAKEKLQRDPTERTLTEH